MSTGIPESAWAEFFAECEEILQRVSHSLPQLEQNTPIDSELVDSLYRDIHTLKGSSQLFAFKNIGLIAHGFEAGLEPIRSHKIPVKTGFVDLIFKCLDLVDQIIKDPNKDLSSDPKLIEEMMVVLPKLISMAARNFNAELEPQRESTAIIEKNEVLSRPEVQTTETQIDTKTTGPDTPKITPTTNSKVEKMEPASSKTTPSPETHIDGHGESSTIRVQVNVLDRLMNLIGEMVLVRNQVLQTFQSTEDYGLANLTQRLDVVTSELQEQVMKTRMQPIGSVVNKFQRVVRDLGRELNKQLDLVIRGADTELDKSLLEAIKDPLTHLVRNSCDHGIEPSADRRKSGKPEMGTIAIKAFHEGGQVVIEISDDGKGLDPQKILAKAIEKKVITPERGKLLSDREIQHLIFAPGFSTAEAVSSVSGRGVGMDVVKTNIEKVGGQVELQSVVGRGTSIRLKIPLTLAIVPAMIVNVSGEQFAIPQVKLQELVRVDRTESSQQVEFLQGKPVYRLRGDLLPLISLKSVLHGVDMKEINKQDVFNIVVLTNDGQPFGLIVDEIQDTADIVVKPLPNFFKKLSIYSGATVMGDGSVALILDVQALADKAAIKKSAQATDSLLTAGASAGKPVSAETQEFLFFSLHHPGRFCMPLVLVQRLEEFPKNAIEVSGQDKVLRYRDSLLPLIDLSDYLGPNQKDSKSDTISIIVVSKRRRQFGIIVNKIADVLSIETHIESPLKEKRGLLGTIIVPPNNVATVVDVLAIIEDIIGDPIETKATVKKKKLKGKILFAEDTIFFVKQVMKVLEDVGLEIVHAPDGEAALKLLKAAKPGEFDLLLSDIEMPKKTGFELAEAVRADGVWKNLPMIALTTRFRESDVAHGKAVGFNHYLEKLKSDQLIDAIRETLGGA